MRRNMFTSSWMRAAIGVFSAAALSLAFPKTGAAWIAPLAAAGLFWSWRALSWKRALLFGWFCGVVFFALMFSWFGETAGAFVGPLGFVLVLGPAVIVGLSYGIAAALAALAFERAPSGIAPLAAAAGFAWAEWLRSTGVLGVPFAHLGYAYVATPLAPLAAFAGSYGITFAVCLLGAYLAQSLQLRDWRPFAAAAAAVAVCTALAFSAWPARNFAAPTLTVAAVQGNITQDTKWTRPAFELAVSRYTSLTSSLTGARPVLVVWPETVITTYLNRDLALQQHFGDLARRLRTMLVVGSVERVGETPYNGLWFFDDHGNLATVYRKRQLVPFAEWVPAETIFGHLPHSDVISRFGHGEEATVVRAGSLAIAPLICWESAFSDLVHDQLARGANVLAITTDDAWFGMTAGPYQHAQIAQMRALESGTWVLRAAATGISGVIAPDGRYTTSLALGSMGVALGRVGVAPGSPFARIGPSAIAGLLGLIYAGSLVLGRRLR